MKNVLTVAAVVAALAGFSGIGHAQGAVSVRDPGVNTRQVNQRQRIRQGVRSGELTRSETRRVAESQRDIRQLERAYKSDGKLTAGERRDLRHEQNQTSRQIYRQKHDDDTRR